MRKHYWIFLGMWLLCASPAFAAERVLNITADTVNALLESTPGIVVLDIRTPAEYQAGAMPKAVNIDFNSPDFQKKITEYAAANPAPVWLVYCRSGNRSQQAMPFLQQALPGTIYHVVDGFRMYKGR